ncbi:MAG: hypothetical protein ACO1NX_01165 [Chitinophagaceae bacterium]
MKIFIAVVLLISSFPGFSRSCSTDNPAYVHTGVLISDTLKIAIEVTVDTTGKAISAAYMEEGSTTKDAKMIEAALKMAKQTTFARKPKAYTQILVFTIVVVG